MQTSSTPAATNGSASLGLAQMMPRAPASSCMRAISGILWVLMWGRKRTWLRSMIACHSAMFRSSRSRSQRIEGVSRLATSSAGSGSNSAISDPLFRQNPRQRGRPLAQGQPAASPSLPPNLYAGYYSPAARSPVSLRALSLAWLQHKLRLSSGIAHRYFPTKEEVVFWSPYQPMLAGFVAARPDHEPAEQALRHGIVDGLAAFYDQDRDRLLERIKLTFRTPALHPRLRQQQADWPVGVAALLADRLDARPDDLEVRAIAAAVAAALFVAIEEWQARDGQGDLGALIDRALGSVLAGPLRATATPKRR